MNENNPTNIKRLLEHYYNGESTEAEEMALKEYFSRNDTAPEFDNDKLIFDALAECKDVSDVPDGLESRLNKAIDSWEAREQPKHAARFLSWKSAVSIAASIAIIAMIGISQLGRRSQPVQPIDSVTDPEIAYVETQRALTMLVTTINKGVKGLETAEQLNEKTLTTAINRLNNI